MRTAAEKVKERLGRFFPEIGVSVRRSKIVLTGSVGTHLEGAIIDRFVRRQPEVVAAGCVVVNEIKRRTIEGNEVGQHERVSEAESLLKLAVQAGLSGYSPYRTAETSLSFTLVDVLETMLQRADVESAIVALCSVEKEIALRQDREEMATAVQVVLGAIPHEYDSIENRRAVAERIRGMLDRFDLRVVCPEHNCAVPSRLVFDALTGSGCFGFEHLMEIGGKLEWVRHIHSPTLPANLVVVTGRSPEPQHLQSRVLWGIMAPVERTEAPATAPTVELIQNRMRDLANESGLSYADIGLRMGAQDRETAKTKLNHLLNKSDNPTLKNILEFCDALRIDLRDLLDTSGRPAHR